MMQGLPGSCSRPIPLGARRLHWGRDPDKLINASNRVDPLPAPQVRALSSGNPTATPMKSCTSTPW